MRRYPEYKESAVDWIGKIPVHWQIVRGKFLFCHKKELNSSFQCDNLLSLTLNGVLRKNMFSADGLRPNDYRTYQVFYRDNLVFKLIDLENIQTSRVGIVPEKGIMSPVYIRLQGKGDLCKRYYFYQYYDLYRKHIFNFLGKGVRSSLSPSNLLEIPLVSPPLPEQHAIANFLDLKTQQIDELIRVKERKIELLGEYRASLITQAVTKGLDPNVEMKPSEVEWIGEIPRHWKVIRNRFIFQQIKDVGHPNLMLLSIGVKGVRPKNQTGQRDVSSDDKSLYKKVRIGDIAFNVMTAWKGGIGMSEYEGIVSPAYQVCRPCTSLVAKYFHYLFRTDLYKAVFDSSSYRVVDERHNLYYDNFKNILSIFPSFSEQIEITNFLDHKTKQIDELRSSEEQTIKLLKEYRQSLISAVVTGKIDVRNEV